MNDNLYTDTEYFGDGNNNSRIEIMSFTLGEDFYVPFSESENNSNDAIKAEVVKTE
jgi:hypothetical protein